MIESCEEQTQVGIQVGLVCGSAGAVSGNSLQAMEEAGFGVVLWDSQSYDQPREQKETLGVMLMKDGSCHVFRGECHQKSMRGNQGLPLGEKPLPDLKGMLLGGQEMFVAASSSASGVSISFNLGHAPFDLPVDKLVSLGLETAESLSTQEMWPSADDAVHLSAQMLQSVSSAPRNKWYISARRDAEAAGQSPSWAGLREVALSVLSNINRIAASAPAMLPIDVPKSNVFESDHDYHPNENVRELVKIEGATSILLEFDSACRTESGCDFFRIYSGTNVSDAGRLLQFSGNFNDNDCWKVYNSAEPSKILNGVRQFVVNADHFTYTFTSDGSSQYWGYKFAVAFLHFASPRMRFLCSGEGQRTQDEGATSSSTVHCADHREYEAALNHASRCSACISRSPHTAPWGGGGSKSAL